MLELKSTNYKRYSNPDNSNFSLPLEVYKIYNSKVHKLNLFLFPLSFDLWRLDGTFMVLQ